MEDHKDIFSAFLFPHSHISEKGIKGILSFFDTVTICQPWHMDPPLSIPIEPRLVRILHPSEDLRPVEGFQQLLSEYKNWMRQHPDKGYASALSALRDYGRRETSTWDIRKAIRKGGAQDSVSETAGTQWHLVLHLAREGAVRLDEADEALSALKRKGSPLQGIADEAEFEKPLDDLPDFECGSGMDEESVERVFEAWNGLFQEQLPEDAILVTKDPRVVSCLTALWGEFCSAEGEPEYGIHFRWPDLSFLTVEELVLEKRKMEGTGWGDLRQLFLGIGKDPAGRLEEMKRLAEDLLRSSAHPAGGKMLQFAVHFFPPCARSGSGRRRALLGGLSGKTLFLLKVSHE